MIRKIIHIDEEKCNGCGLCAEACHEGAIDIVNGKAKFMRETSVMASGTACRDVRPARSLSKSVRLRNTMNQQ